jgi:formylglycine-generating enzyme required for sulfatase activity
MQPPRTPTATIQKHRATNQFYEETLAENVRLRMMLIPAGQFMMGSRESEESSRANERLQRSVSIETFFLGKHPITQAQYEAVMGENPSFFKDEPDSSNHPVENVLWDKAIKFCDRLSKQTDKEYRLPSEAEWEYACRARTTTPFHFGETLDAKVANYNATFTYGRGQKGEYVGKTTPVGSFKVANAFGLYDMHGNVWEWCEDDWHDTYKDAPSDGSAWVESDRTGTGRLLRGGSWDSDPRYCRSAFRGDFTRFNFLYDVGFRVCCVPPRLSS